MKCRTHIKAIKIQINPNPKGTPASMGAANGTLSLADHPSQKSEAANRGPPRQASGSRRHPSLFLLYHVLPTRSKWRR